MSAITTSAGKENTTTVGWLTACEENKKTMVALRDLLGRFLVGGSRRGYVSCTYEVSICTSLAIYMGGAANNLLAAMIDNHIPQVMSLE